MTNFKSNSVEKNNFSTKQILKRMKFRIFFIIALVSIFTVLISCFYNNDDKQKVVLALTYNYMKSLHYENLTFDDDFSQRVYKKYLESIDYSKRFLLASDVKKLDKFKDNLDDQIRQSDLSFFKMSYNLILQRQLEAKAYYTEILSQPFDFSTNESITIEPEDLDFANNKKELYDFWRKSLKAEVLEDVVNEINAQEEKKKKSDTVKLKTFEEIEKNARESVKKNYDLYFERTSQLTEEDYYSLYINAIVQSGDPHSEYLAPKNKEDFDIHMSGELEGIGATLSQKEGEIKVEDVVAGGAAWKQGELEEGDIILNVAQEGQAPVNVTSMRLDDAVRLIRGKKGTTVTLTVKKLDGTIKEIKIVRDKIILEETYIKSIILTDSTGHKVAYINMPSFYIDFQNQGGRKCSEDFKKELLKLKNENVEGVIIDLRNNGGGSLQEVVKIAGFFIDKGPIVQVKDRNGKINQLQDVDASVLYDGNVLIMTNYFSASASEIFAAALQDYNRAIIFGTNQTLGKGTVQEMINLDNTARISPDIKPLGALKLTIQKFYRINGGSTQLKGVAADISCPNIYDYLDLFESSYDYALPWDNIPALKYNIWTPKYNVDSLKIWSKRRMLADSAYISTQKYARDLKVDDQENEIPLQIDKFKAYSKSKLNNRSSYIKNTSKNIKIDFKYFADDMNAMQKDTIMKGRYDSWSNKLKKDFLLTEAFNIVVDMNSFK